MLLSRAVLCAMLALPGGIAVCPAATNYVNDATGDDGYDGWTPALPKKTIQASLNAVAVTGDTVLVADGNYVQTNTITVSKGVTLCSANGREAVVIDGNNSNRCLLISHSNALVSGFTIINGRTHAVGGAGYGGGVYMTNGLMADCTVSNNLTSAMAGGVYLSYQAVISNCIIANNTSTNGKGGGLAIYGTAQARDCLIMQNSATKSGIVGGGVYLVSGLLENCRVISNTCSIGGGMALDGGLARNSLVAQNNSSIYGAGIYFSDNSTGVAQNCTICSNNRYGVSGNGTIAANGYFENCVVYSNGVGNWYLPAGGVSFTNCCIIPTNGLPGGGNITNEPGFINFTEMDYRLVKHSPCINTGKNQSWMNNAFDLDGWSRIDRFAGRVDMGCYEYILSGTIFRICGN